MFVISIETRVSRQEVRRVLASFCVHYLKIVTLESQVPTFNARWWFRLGVAENQLNRLAVSDQFEMTAIEIKMEPLDCPDDC